MNLYASISLPTSLLKKKLSLIVIYIGTCTMQLHVINLSFIEFDDFFFDILLSFSKEVWRGGVKTKIKVLQQLRGIYTT